MANELLTADGMHVLAKVTPGLRNAMQLFNEMRFNAGQETVTRVRDILVSARTESPDDDALLTDLFVLNRYVGLVAAYGRLWERIVSQQFRDSWDHLQDALDLLRLIKRFSRINVSFFEEQLVGLEEAYPYRIFNSVGMVVSYFECSICGHDMDSSECSHMRGELYHGEMAYGIARGAVSLDHVALVTNPADKRCVITYEDSAEEFSVIRYISGLVHARRLRLSDFVGLEWTKRQRPNPDFLKSKRNDPCPCGSGRKFKKCCISKREIEGDHVQILAYKRDIRDAVV